MRDTGSVSCILPSVLPRFFVRRSDSGELPAPDPNGAHLAVDRLRLGSRHQAEQEWVIASDGLGNLLAVPEGAALPAHVQAQTGYHELASSQRPRLLDGAEFYLFNLQLLEQPARCPGLEDPVYLYGTLFGPYPAPGGVPPGGIEGQLTVTRGDLLDGLVQGANYAFRYAPPDGVGAPPRCFHALLPGDRQEALEGGRGLILAYPLLPSELSLHHEGNEFLVNSLFFDLLKALQEDAAAAHIPTSLTGVRLPVPSRPLLEQELEAQGYAIEGDSAVKKVESAEGFRGLLASVFGRFVEEEMALPVEGEIEDYLSLAGQALKSLPGFPPPRISVLRRRTMRDSLGRMNPVPTARPVSPAAPPPPRPKLSMPVRGKNEPPDWMCDFISAHQQPGKEAARLTKAPTAPPPPKRKPTNWMNDFEQPISPSPKQAKSEPTEKPKWMQDFDSTHNG